MSMDIGTFTGDILINATIHKRYGAARATELTAIATSLGTDTSKHDKTIEAAPPGFVPGHWANTPFSNDILLNVNTGKAGNLTNAAMATAITNLAGALP